jgi:hypothetical protein
MWQLLELNIDWRAAHDITRASRAGDEENTVKGTWYNHSKSKNLFYLSKTARPAAGSPITKGW